MRTLLGLGMLAVVSMIGCGNKEKPIQDVEQNDIIVKSQAVMEISSDSPVGKPHFATKNQSVPVSVTNASQTTMTIDTSLFNVPAISNSLLDFGNIVISGLTDNDLKVCGIAGNQKCGTAIFRVYTTGTAGSGLYNADEGYGLPMTSGLTTPLSIGLGSGAAAVMQTISIPTSKHVVRLADFTPSPSYNIKVDFTDAGAGTFATTLVIEYALAP